MQRWTLAKAEILNQKGIFMQLNILSITTWKVDSIEEGDFSTA